MRVEATSAPADDDLLVTLASVKSHLSVGIDDDDDYITGLIGAVGECLDGPDGVLARSIRDHTYRLTLGEFPVRSWSTRWRDRDVYAYASPRRVETMPRIRLPYGPVKSVASVVWTDYDDEEHTLADTRYEFRDRDDVGYLYPIGDEGWPDTNGVRKVVIVYRCFTGSLSAEGVATIRVPRPVQVAARMMVQGLYDHRDATPMRKDMPVESPQIMQLLKPYMLSASMSADNEEDEHNDYRL